MSTYKSVAIRDELACALAVRLPALAQTLSFSVAGTPATHLGDPCLQLGSGGIGAIGCLIRVTSASTLALDAVMGTAQRVMTPHIIQVAYEAGAGGATVIATDTMAFLSAVLGEVFSKGCKVELWAETTGTAPSITTFDTAAKLTNGGSFEPSVQYPGMGNQ